ncbi:hypothetical protein VTH06DRAFT_1061 [Thermothelomyces fergusii]
MRGGATGTSASPRGLTLPMRYLMRKRLKNPAPLEIPERRQVGDVEAILGSSSPTPSPSPSDGQTAAAGGGQQHHRHHYHYPARGSDSVL